MSRPSEPAVEFPFGARNRSEPSTRRVNALLLTKESHARELVAIFRTPDGAIFRWAYPYAATKAYTDMAVRHINGMTPGHVYSVSVDDSNTVTDIGNTVSKDVASCRIAARVWRAFKESLDRFKSMTEAFPDDPDTQQYLVRAFGVETNAMNQELARVYKLVEEDGFGRENMSTFPIYSIFPKWNAITKERNKLDIDNVEEFGNTPIDVIDKPQGFGWTERPKGPPGGIGFGVGKQMAQHHLFPVPSNRYV